MQDQEKQPLTQPKRQQVDGLVRETTAAMAAGLLCLLLLVLLSLCTWSSAARLYPQPYGDPTYLWRQHMPASSIAIFRCPNPRSDYLEDILPELLNTLPAGLYDSCSPAEQTESLFKHQVAWLPLNVPQAVVEMVLKHQISPIVDDRGKRRDLYKASDDGEVRSRLQQPKTDKLPVIWLSDFDSPEQVLEHLKGYS